MKRGFLTFGFDRHIEKLWFHKKTGPTARGLDKTFRDVALQTRLMLRLHYKLSRPSVEAFVNSLLAWLVLPLTCPNYTRFSKTRGSRLNVAIPRQLPDGPVNVVADSTGLQVSGEGKWKMC